MFSYQPIRAPLTTGRDIAAFQLVAVEVLVALSEYSDGEAGGRFICTPLGANPVAALTELLEANSTRGKCAFTLSFIDDHREHLSYSVIH